MDRVPSRLHRCPQAQVGVKNKVVDALSRRRALLFVMSTEVVGFEKIKYTYESCPDFENI